MAIKANNYNKMLIQPKTEQNNLYFCIKGYHIVA